MADSEQGDLADAQSTAGKIGLGVGVAILVGFAVALALLGKPPAKLPGAALGSETVLYIERGAAVFVVELLALVVVWRAFQGRLPDKLSGRGVEYALREKTAQLTTDTTTTLDELTAADAGMNKRVRRLENRVFGQRQGES